MPISANHALHHLRPLHSEWGLSLLLEPQRGDEKRSFLLDFGWAPEVINIGNKPDVVPWHETDLPVRSGHISSWGRNGHPTLARPLPVLGTERTSSDVRSSVAIGGKADMAFARAHVFDDVCNPLSTCWFEWLDWDGVAQSI